MKELLLHTSTWKYFIQNVKIKKQVAEYTHSIIPYCTKFGILKLNTHLINIHAYNVSRKPYKGLMLQEDASVEGKWKMASGRDTQAALTICAMFFNTILSF